MNTVHELRKILPQKVSPSAPVFDGLMPDMEQFRTDLGAATISYVDPQGDGLIFMRCGIRLGRTEFSEGKITPGHYLSQIVTQPDVVRRVGIEPTTR